MTITLPDLENLHISTLSEFEQRTRGIGPNNTSHVARELARLEGELAVIYRFAVLTQRREESMETAFAVWDAMVHIGDSFLAKLDHLLVQAQVSADDAASVSRDKLLDFRLAAEKRRELHRAPQTAGG